VIDECRQEGRERMCREETAYLQGRAAKVGRLVVVQIERRWGESVLRQCSR
jgi:hypothetical protein